MIPIALFTAYTILFVLLLIAVIRIRFMLSSRAWDYITGGFVLLFLARYTGIVVVFRPEIRTLPDTMLAIQILFHGASILGFLVLVSGFILLGNNLRSFNAKGKQMLLLKRAKEAKETKDKDCA